MLTVPWFVIRTAQRAWAYTNPEIPSTGGVRTGLSTGSEQTLTPEKKQLQQQQQQQQQQQKKQELIQKQQQQQQKQDQVQKQQQPQQQQQQKPVTQTKVTPTQAVPTSAIPRPKQAPSSGRMSDQWAQEQVDKFKFDFDQADKDKSGSLSIKEVLDVLQAVGFRGSEREGLFIFSHLDKNKDRKISRDEFSAAMKGLPRLTIKEFVLRKAFLALDKDNNGTLSRAEIEDATKKDAGIDIAAEKIADLLVYLCKEDKDGKVDYEEFLRVFGVESTATVMSQVFKKLDADNSGCLTKDEIMKAVESEFELKLSAEKISDLLCAWCKDDDKKISYGEFVKVWLQQKEQKKK